MERSHRAHRPQRGRGGSGDTPPYALAREAEDVRAVLAAVGPAAIVGHSYGGLCAFEGVQGSDACTRLVAYESIPAAGTAYDPLALRALDDADAAGDPEQVLEVLMLRLVGLTPAELGTLRADRASWERRLANARTAAREIRTECAYRFDPATFAALPMPVRLLVGERSPPIEHEHVRLLAAAGRDVRVHLLPGAGHAGMRTDPAGFVAAVEASLAD